MYREDYTGQIFSNREIIRNYCTEDDWVKIGKAVPNDIHKYRLSKCLNCGAVLPVLMKNVFEQPPKRCCFCSNIRNTSNTIQPSTNSWAKYDTYAVLNVLYHDTIIQSYIDIDDYDIVSSRIWRVSKKRNKYYLVSGSKTKNNIMYLHRLILRDKEVPDGYEIDHIDGNSLNNRKSNLRIVSRLQNIQNVSERIDNQLGIRGVSPNGHGKYIVDFCFNGHRYYFKHWDSIEEAAYCRQVLEEHFGLEMISRNPNMKNLNELPVYKQQEIYDYVQQKIS